MTPELVEQLKEAVEKDEISIAFQPAVDCSTNSICSFTAFPVCNRMKSGTIYLSLFDISFDPVLLKTVQNYMIEKICQMYLVRKNLAGEPFVPVAINYSCAMRDVSAWLEEIERLLEIYHMPKSALTFVLSDSVFTAVSENAKGEDDTIREMRESGYKVRLNISERTLCKPKLIKDIEVDELETSINKIINEQGEARYNPQARIYEAGYSEQIVSQMIITGITDSDQISICQDLGFTRFQGDYFAEPMPYMKAVDEIKSKNIRFL